MEPSGFPVRHTAEMPDAPSPSRFVRVTLWLAIIVVICTLAGGWPGLVFGAFGALGGFWVTWTAEQHTRTD